MQRSSTKIGALATALAKAQSELANPEKSLTATLPPSSPGGAETSFRYASLASGLDIVRKCLGRHEIAMVQTTTIDRDTGLIRLTSTLVHSSGEWMSSDWPVCPAIETLHPHRMGAALTYARRYGLFTLVGIAGEDELDAPDMDMAAPPTGREELTNGLSGHPARPAFSRAPSATSGGATRGRGSGVLGEKDSADLRDHLIAELATLEEHSALTGWALKALPRKNRLSNEHALAVEAAFGDRLAGLAPTTSAAPEPSTSATAQEPMAGRNGHEPTLASGSVPKVMVLSKPVRDRDRHHLKFVAGRPCLVCGRTPSDPHHVKFAENWTAGRKVSDRFTVPLCRLHHRELHRRGNERSWWRQKGIDPLKIAKTLWDKSHARSPDEDASTGSEYAMSQNDETNPIARPEV